MELANPIMPRGADPWVIYHNNYYYYCHADETVIYLSRAETMIGLSKAKPVVVWEAPPNTPYSKEVWAPELHFLKGKPYIYFAASDGVVDNHRMFVLQSGSPNILGPYEYKGMVTPGDVYAIDGTILRHNGSVYFVWSGIDHAKHRDEQRLYISQMSDPYTLSTPGVAISAPEYDWERNGPAPVNEGPTVLKSFNKIFIVYSASHSLTDFYCLGLLTLTGDDPLDPQAWTKHPHPVFASTEDVYAPGHASFTVSPDGEENWIIYHAAVASGSGWERDVRAQRFNWHDDGTPDFGIPVSPKMRMSLPSGDTHLIDHYFVDNLPE